MAGGMGSIKITHTEIQAWQLNTGIDLQPWEVSILRRLSQDYLEEYHRAEKPECPPPYLPTDLTEKHRESVGKKVADTMRLLLTKGNK